MPPMETTSEAARLLRELLLERVWRGRRPDPGLDGAGARRGRSLSRQQRHRDGGIAGGGSHTWERGWQPADVMHVVRRDTSVRALRLMAALIAAEARLTKAAARAPSEWVDQLHAIGALAGSAPPGVHAWHRTGSDRPRSRGGTSCCSPADCACSSRFRSSCHPHRAGVRRPPRLLGAAVRRGGTTHGLSGGSAGSWPRRSRRSSRRKPTPSRSRRRSSWPRTPSTRRCSTRPAPAAAARRRPDPAAARRGAVRARPR